MTRYHGSEAVKSGYYWNRKQWEIIAIGKRGGILPGEKSAGYLRIPLLLVVLLGPLMGGLYVILLPLMGIVMTIGFLGKKLFLMAGRGMGCIPAREKAADNGKG